MTFQLSSSRLLYSARQRTDKNRRLMFVTCSRRAQHLFDPFWFFGFSSLPTPSLIGVFNSVFRCLRSLWRPIPSRRPKQVEFGMTESSPREKATGASGHRDRGERVSEALSSSPSKIKRSAARKTSQADQDFLTMEPAKVRDFAATLFLLPTA